MLNTDAHNPAIKASRKMTKEQFVRNNRGLDDGQDLPHEFLETLHDRIVANEIKMQPFKNDAGDKSILAYTNPHKQGWLKKEGGHFKAWKDKWFLLKDSCLYYLNKPPVWGGDSELSGHIALHTSLVARATRDSDQGLLILEMTNGTMLKTGKIEKRANVMKTTVVNSLRLQASSPSEAQEWAKAINANVKALNDARQGLPAPEWTRRAGGGGGGGAVGAVEVGATGGSERVKSLPTGAVAAKRDTSLPMSPPTAGGAEVSSLPNMRISGGAAAGAGEIHQSRSAPAGASLPPSTPTEPQTAAQPAPAQMRAAAAEGGEAAAGLVRGNGGPASPPPLDVIQVPLDAAQALPPAHALLQTEQATEVPLQTEQATASPDLLFKPHDEDERDLSVCSPAGGAATPAGGAPASDTARLPPFHTSPAQIPRAALEGSGSLQRCAPPVAAAQNGHDRGAAGGGDDGGEGLWRPRSCGEGAGRAEDVGGSGEGGQGDGSEHRRWDVEDDGDTCETLRIGVEPGLELSLTAPRAVHFDAGLRQRLVSFYTAELAWPLEQSHERMPQLSALHMALAGFSFEPDQDYEDRVVCKMCGLSVGSWEVRRLPLPLSDLARLPALALACRTRGQR
jgi:hypothetical protein